VAPKPGGPRPEPVSSRFLRTLVHPDRKASLVDVRFFAGGTRLFAAGYPSGVVQVFDPATGKEVRRIDTPPGLRSTDHYAAPTADFRTLYVAVDRRKVVSFEQDGQKQYRVEYNGELLAWDLTSGNPLPSLPPSVPGRGVLAVYAAPTGDRLVTIERSPYGTGELQKEETLLWDLAARTAKSLGPAYGRAVFSPDGRRIAIAHHVRWKESMLEVWDLARRTVVRRRPTAEGRGFSWATFSPDGKVLAIEDAAGGSDQPATMRFYEVETGKELASFDSAGKYSFLYPTFSPDGRRFAVIDFGENLTIWDTTARKIERRMALSGLFCARSVFSPDGAYLAVLTQPKFREADVGRTPAPADLPQPRVLLYDLTRGGEPEVLVCPHGYRGGLAFSPDGKTLAVGGAGGVHLFDVSKPPAGQ
jgi:WD40 repeat protein